MPSYGHRCWCNRQAGCHTAYSHEFGPSDHELWDAEYNAHVKASDWLNVATDTKARSSELDLSGYALPYNFLEEFENMEPAERQFILDELADRPELWDEESEVMCL